MIYFWAFNISQNTVRILLCDNIPVQLSPSPVYPGRQVQVKLPGVLLQLAVALHPPLFTAHSSMSTRSAVTI